MFIIEIKKLIRNFCNKNESLFNHQLKCEFLKHEAPKFTIQYAKQIPQEKWQPKNSL